MLAAAVAVDALAATHKLLASVFESKEKVTGGALFLDISFFSVVAGGPSRSLS